MDSLQALYKSDSITIKILNAREREGENIKENSNLNSFFAKQSDIDILKMDDLRHFR